MAPSQLQQFDRLHRVVHRSPCRLDDLIATVDGQAGDDPIERLATASALAADVAQLGDSLLGHFVDVARRAGHPWSQIGAALGVSRQAAQQRFVEPDLRRYTDRARRAVDLAVDAARRLGQPAVGTEHVLLGLGAEGQGVAAAALTAAGAFPDGLEAEIARSSIAEPAAAAGEGAEPLPFSPSASRLLSDLARAEAITLGHNYVGTEHVLLALLRRPTRPVAAALAAVRVQPDRVRSAVLQLMGGLSPSTPS